MKKIIAGTLLTFSLAMAGGDIVMKEEVAVEPVPMVTEENNKWQQSIAIYGWLPSLDGTLNYNIPGDDPATGESNIIDKIDSVFMGAYSVRKNKWSFLTDVIYLKMSDSQQVSGTVLDVPFEASSQQDLTLWVVNAYGGYNLVDKGSYTLDMIAGLRYLSLDLDLSFNLNSAQLNLSPSGELYDGVVGFRGQVDLNENWYISYLVDVGAGDSDLTAQAFAGLGYRFGWGDVLLTYRYLYYDEGNDNFINTLDVYGPKLGVLFHF